jgi:hypothetical protein
MTRQAVRLGCGWVVTRLSGFVVWFCCLLANLGARPAGMSEYVENAVGPVFDASGYSAGIR